MKTPETLEGVYSLRLAPVAFGGDGRAHHASFTPAIDGTEVLVSQKSVQWLGLGPAEPTWSTDSASGRWKLEVAFKIEEANIAFPTSLSEEHAGEQAADAPPAPDPAVNPSTAAASGPDADAKGGDSRAGDAGEPALAAATEEGTHGEAGDARGSEAAGSGSSGGGGGGGGGGSLEAPSDAAAAGAAQAPAAPMPPTADASAAESAAAAHHAPPATAGRGEDQDRKSVV